MNIDLSLPSCNVTGICSGCGACDTFVPGGAPTFSTYNPDTAPSDIRTVIWEDPGMVTWFTEGRLGTPTVITYSFGGANDAVDFSDHSQARIWEREWGVTREYREIPDHQKAAIRSIADVLSQVSGVMFVETKDPTKADIVWSNTLLRDLDVINPGIMPGHFSAGGTIFINTRYNNYWETLDFTPGERGFGDVAHEFGHMIGLKHGFFGRYALPQPAENRGVTVMSHVDAPSGMHPTNYMPLDQRALQYIYGTSQQRAELGIQWRQWVSDGTRDGLVTLSSPLGGAVSGLENARDYMVGGVGHDRLFGRGGADLLVGGGGLNSLNGGQGTDLAGLPSISSAALTNGEVKVVSWVAGQAGASRSGLILKPDGSVDLFRDIEGLAFADRTLMFAPAPRDSVESLVERLIEMVNDRGRGSSGYEWWLSHVRTWQPDLSELLRYLITDDPNFFPLSTSSSAPSALSQFWSRVYPSIAVPEALERWVAVTGDLRGALDAILYAPAQAWQALVNPQVPTGTWTAPVDMRTDTAATNQIVTTLYAKLLHRAPSAEELRRASDDIRFDGLPAEKLALRLMSGTEFLQQMAAGSPHLAAIFGGHPLAQQIREGSWSYEEGLLLGRHVVNAAALPADRSAALSVLDRNGTLGFTVVSELGYHDKVLGYSGSWDIQRLYKLSDGRVVIENKKGQEVSLPSSVNTIELFDGVLHIGPLSSRKFVDVVIDGLFGGASAGMQQRLGSVLDALPGDPDAALRLVFDHPIFRQEFDWRFGWMSGEQLSKAMYRSLLGREPDFWGQHHFLNGLAQGAPRLELAFSIATSGEADQRLNSQAFGFSWAHDQSWEDVHRVFNGVVFRPPNDPSHMEVIKLGVLDTSQYLISVISAPEIAQGVRIKMAPEEFLGFAYRATLDRDPTAIERVEWSKAFTQGLSNEGVLFSMMFSPETDLRYSSSINVSWGREDALLRPSAGRDPGTSLEPVVTLPTFSGVGSEVANLLVGGPSADSFHGGGGADVVVGGAGWDVATYRGRRSEYFLSLTNEGHLLVRDTVANRDGDDLLIGVEGLQFVNQPIYRFFNTQAGGHLFTTSEVERDHIIQKHSNYRFEGASLAAPGASWADTPVYRLFHTKAGGHLFTTSLEERDTTLARLPHYRDEGVAFYVASTPSEGFDPVFRFFNSAAGGHLFTSSPIEAGALMQVSQFTYEGIAFYAPTASPDAPLW